MDFSPLTDERNQWRRQLESGSLLSIYVLQQYRLNRNSNLWRSTREVEKLCETILFLLEGAKPMSESYIVKCDQCDLDISYSGNGEAYRIRLSEEMRMSQNAPVDDKKELQRSMNFCNLAHMKEWLEQPSASA